MLHKDFVYLDEVVPGFLWNAKYATSDNLTGAPLIGYLANRIVGTKALADAVCHAAELFLKQGYRLYGFDAYRPQCSIQSFIDWANRPEDGLTKEKFYPELNKSQLFELDYISERSGHSRGSSIDLTLATMDGTKLDMGGHFDLMHERSHHDFDQLPPLQQQNRETLLDGMLECGFKPYINEWWHYNLKPEPYPDTYFDFVID